MTKHDFELYIISTVSFSVKLSQAENHCFTYSEVKIEEKKMFEFQVSY